MENDADRTKWQWIVRGGGGKNARGVALGMNPNFDEMPRMKPLWDEA